MKFQNAAAAGAELALRLNEFHGSSQTIVIAIVSGGVGVGAEVGRRLKLPFELLFIRRLLAPLGPQRVLGATNVGGTLIVDEEVPQASGTNGLDHAIADAIKQLSERERFCRGARAPVDISGKQVILVDNGIHTGSTMLAAIRGVRKLGVTKVVAAVPVADASSRAVIERAANEVFCLVWPEKFGHVGLWYRESIRPANEQILNLYLRGEETMNE
ncbi:MAG TPA: phosphoribosyltransferase family protein [Pyrinomonadaceae bacterium]|nr:phosphoribosyltransferase family protein [Pyrinomonadaceae bacterium]